jgi:hypothetical protein
MRGYTKNCNRGSRPIFWYQTMNNKNPDNLFIEIPPTQHSPYQDRVPSALNPMGEIYLRARVLRTLGGGNVRWWVLISGWLMFGGGFLAIAWIMISTQSYASIFQLAITAIPLVSLWRGTAKKLAQRRRGHR